MFRQVTKRFLTTTRATNTAKFAQHLTSEINGEKEQLLPVNFDALKKLNWDIQVAGAAVEMKKEISNNEKATVAFSINGSIPSINDMEEDEREAYSIPDFIINLEKENHEKIVQYGSGILRFLMSWFRNVTHCN